MSRLLRVSLLIAAIVAALVVSVAAAQDPIESPRPEDQARAEEIVLKASDLQGRWRATRAGGGTASVNFRCPSPANLRGLTLTGASLSPLFRGGRGVLVGAAVEIYATQEDARAAFDRSVVRGAVVPCGGRHYPVVASRGQRLRLRSAATATTVTYGDATVRWRFVWRVSSGRRMVPAYSDVYFALEDRVLLSVVFFSDPFYVAPGFQQALVSKLEERI